MQSPLNQQLALEMAMQDVMDNMEELALDFGFAGGEACFELLAIEPATVPGIAEPACGTTLRSPFSAEMVDLIRSRSVA